MLPSECSFFIGLHRPDLSILHNVDALAADVDLAVSFLYTVSLGVSITTNTQLAAVEGDPKRLSPRHCVRRVTAKLQKVSFSVGQRLIIETKDVHSAMRRISRAPGSKFTVAEANNPPSASGETFCGDIRAVVDWAFSARRVENELGPKSFDAGGFALHA